MLNLLKHPVVFSQPERIAFSAWHGHVPFAMLAVDLFRPKVLVELGTHFGISYCAFCQAVKTLHLPTRCYAIDTWKGDPHSGIYGENVLQELSAHHNPRYSSFSELIQLSFDDALQNFADGSIDLLHIDGYHTYDAVRHDFQNWLPKLSSRGIVLLHDTNVHRDDFGVWRLWSSLKDRYPTFEFIHGHGLGVAFVGDEAEMPEGFRALLDLADTELYAFRTMMAYLADRQVFLNRLNENEGHLAHANNLLQQEVARREALIATHRTEQAQLYYNMQVEKNSELAQQQTQHQAEIEGLHSQFLAKQQAYEAHLAALVARHQAEMDAFNHKYAQLREAWRAQTTIQLAELQQILEWQHQQVLFDERRRAAEELTAKTRAYEFDLVKQRQNQESDFLRQREEMTAQLAAAHAAQVAPLREEIQRIKSTRAWRTIEAFWRLRQLIATAFRILFTQGPFALINRLIRWLRGERRYHQRNVPEALVTRPVRRGPLWRLAQLIRTAFRTLFTQGPFALVNRLIKWLRGERRYYQRADVPSAVTSTPVQPTLVSHSPSEAAPFSKEVRRAPFSLIVAVMGNASEVEYDVYNMLEAVVQLRNLLNAQVIVVADGDLWYHTARRVAPQLNVLRYSELPCSLPAKLFNHALTKVNTPWVMCVLPGADTAAWLAAVDQLTQQAADLNIGEIAGLAGHRTGGEYTRLSSRSYRIPLQADGTPNPRYPNTVQSGWLEMMDTVSPYTALLNRQMLVDSGSFAEAPLMQYAFWWEACLRLARSAIFKEADILPPSVKCGLEDFPFQETFQRLPMDEIARAVVRYNTLAKPENIPLLLTDMPTLRIEFPDQSPRIALGDSDKVRAAVAAIRPRWPNHPLRITILGGEYEPHHTQLFFLNYFKLIEGMGLLSWRVIDDSFATEQDIDCADLVIYNRVRSENACRLMDYANAQGKPVLYMLDDNWFTIGKEWPDMYGELIRPGLPFYENALYNIRRSSAVLTFNHVLEEYLKPHAKRVIRISPNVNLRLFPKVTTPPQRDGLLIGFAGSPRREILAFEALTVIARRHQTAKIFYVGWGMPEVMSRIPQNQLIVKPYQFSYANYARELCLMQPDIGIAPLNTSIAEQSKIPTKYMEYAAMGCAGVYSEIVPYTLYVKHGETGILTPGKSVDQWVDAIEACMKPDTLARIKAASYADVQNTLTTDVVMPSFLEAILSVYQIR